MLTHGLLWHKMGSKSEMSLDLYPPEPPWLYPLGGFRGGNPGLNPAFTCTVIYAYISCIMYVNEIDDFTGCLFLSDIFETLIAPPILKISSFCKVVMTNKTGQVCGKNVRRYISNSFRKFVQWRHIIKMPITPSILKISSFCKVVMTNQTGPFDN